MIDQTLIEEAKCYLCLGMSMQEALKLALLARISDAEQSGSFSVLPITTSYLREEFVGGTGATGQVGEMGWAFTATAQTRYLDVASPYFSTWQFRTSGAASNSAHINLNIGTSSGAGWLTHINITNWRHRFIFRLDNVAEVFARVGPLSGNPSGTSELGGFYLKLNTAESANFQFCSRTAAAGTETAVDTGVVADTEWHKLTISSTTVGTAIFQLDSGPQISISSDLPTSPLTPTFNTVAIDANVKGITVDFWDFLLTGLVR